MTSKEQKVITIFALCIILILISLGGIFVFESIREKRTVDTERSTIQAFYLAEAGANIAFDKLDTLINMDLKMAIKKVKQKALVNQIASYIDNGSALTLLRDYLRNNATLQLELAKDKLFHSSGPEALGNGSYNYSIAIAGNKKPKMIKRKVWDFPYRYVITSTGVVQSAVKKITFSGDFTLRVQKDKVNRRSFTAFSEDIKNKIIWEEGNS